MRKDYLNAVIYNTPVLLWIKKLSSLIYRMLFYVNVYGSYKLLKQSSFLAHPVHTSIFSLHWSRHEIKKMVTSRNQLSVNRKLSRPVAQFALCHGIFLQNSAELIAINTMVLLAAESWSNHKQLECRSAKFKFSGALKTAASAYRCFWIDTSIWSYSNPAPVNTVLWTTLVALASGYSANNNMLNHHRLVGTKAFCGPSIYQKSTVMDPYKLFCSL